MGKGWRNSSGVLLADWVWLEVDVLPSLLATDL